ncbi:MAG TPA: HAMP domain-containing sensor histidine kinase, partial [Gemmatimonadaceae bacterium]|nr:HAMP domain-containing sensor histidine kinase [Gemmatimonadaceae bacterium]
GVRGAVTTSATVAIIAIAFTATGHGPFVNTALHEKLLALQTFIGVSGATFLVLGSSMSERRNALREVHAARESAETANRAKSGFLAVISHELRTPLNAIMGCVELLLLEIDGPLTEKQRGVLDRIRQSQRHLLSLIDDVLGFAQVEAGRLKFALQPVAVRDVLIAVESIVGQEAARKGIAFKSIDADSDVFVQADPDKLRQVLLNLVTNSLKFTPSGGTISVDTHVTDARVVIRVSDTGIGISRDNLPHVFEPFFQVDQGGTRRYPGVGLGLSIVRDAVLAMNGDVAIDSEPGKGTVVTIQLPVDHSNSTSATTPSPHSLDDPRESMLT